MVRPAPARVAGRAAYQGAHSVWLREVPYSYVTRIRESVQSRLFTPRTRMNDIKRIAVALGTDLEPEVRPRPEGWGARPV